NEAEIDISCKNPQKLIDFPLLPSCCTIAEQCISPVPKERTKSFLPLLLILIASLQPALHSKACFFRYWIHRSRQFHRFLLPLHPDIETNISQSNRYQLHLYFAC